MHHENLTPNDFILNRRDFLRRTGMGFGALGLATLGGADNAFAARPATGAPHFAPRAKRVIHIFLNGGMSHVDTFDPKPALARFSGKKLPLEGILTERPTGGALPTPFQFSQCGESGVPVSELFPHLSQCVDDMCIIRSMHTDNPVHGPSLLLMNCGDARLPRPSVGSWVTYGLGTENQNLPGFISMCPGGYPEEESKNWQAGFLPGNYQGNYIDSQHTDVEKLIENIKSHYTSARGQRRQLELLGELNALHQATRQADDAIESRIQSFELAYRMQLDATDAFDIAQEPEYIRAMYGETVQARQCLIARRLLERGVRFIQLWHGPGRPWDSHDEIDAAHRRLCMQCDQGIAALIMDLKQRGMLEDTLLVCVGEFGRTPTVEIQSVNQGVLAVGRDHNHYGFSAWMAGGGVKGGYIHGATDEFGFKAVENPVHVHDLHATMLHLLGFDHTELTYRYAGRDFRLTDVYGNVVHDIIA
ncbi:MAG: hypothetical protein AMXMBFR84_04530 [Candidatus Hydrogenedentota bacterium]